MSRWQINYFKGDNMKELIVKLSGYRFVDHVENVIKEDTFNLSMIMDHKGYHGQQENVKRFGGIKLMGYFYDCRKYVKLYVLKTIHGDLMEYYALNKTNARNLAGSKVLWIMEVIK